MSLMANAVMAQQAGAGQPQSKSSETRDPVVPARWPAEKATTWYAKQPWLVGCNFIPSTAINQLEMWQADTFDPVTIDRELGWASGMGMNTVRVYLHDLLWQQDSEGFLKRMDQFLGIADKHHIITLFVLCDSVWNPHPKLGKQPEPKPHVHNSGWVQSPHIEVLRDELQHDSLAPYFKGVISRFKDDSRVLGWDLYNEPGNEVDLFKSLTAGNHPGTAQPSDLPAPVRFIENLAAGKNQTVVTMGTSLTKGGNWVPQMKDLLEQKYPNLAKVVNLGRDASSTAAPKGRCGLDMVKAVVAAKPDAVFIEYGMNDCYLRYEITPEQSAKNLNTIIDTILAANPQTEVILQTMNSCKDYPEKNPPWLHASNRPKLADYYQIQRDIARKRNLRLIDHYPAWLAVMNNDPARFDKLVPDRIHPNAEGAREIIMPTLIKELGL
jgi:lysophospholipase L1-like esterase